jgi:uncharacterized membrane protein YgdD (TMEM256/DUF423 family)
MSIQLPLTSPVRLLLGIGAISAMLAVMLGAFGAHALRARLAPELLAVYQTGVQYHFYHSLGMILVGILAMLLPGRVCIMWSGWLMAAGIVLFSGSLYALALSGVRILGAITPLGGVAFIASWLTLAIGVFHTRP